MKQPMIAAAALLATLLVPAIAGAVEASIQLELGTAGDFQRRTVVYDCGAELPITVSYINAAPNFLALVPIADEPELHVFASVISTSGVRYASGNWIWSTQGADASLSDTTLGEEAEPVLACSELNNTP